MMMKKLLVILLALVLTLSLVACGASKSAYYDASDYYAEDSRSFSNGYYALDAEAEAPATVDGGLDSGKKAEQKIIITANITFETLNFESAVANLKDTVAKCGGYFESSSVGGNEYKWGDYTIRIPEYNYETFMQKVGSDCHCTRQSENRQDISEQYYDTLGRLDSANIKLERLQELLKQATNMEDIITIENAISDTEYYIDSYSGTIKHYDAQVEYATIYVDLNEVYRYSGEKAAPIGFKDRFTNSLEEGWTSFVNFMEELAIFVASNWAILILLAVIIFLIVRGIKRRKAHGPKPKKEKKNRKGKRSKKNAPVAEETPASEETPQNTETN